MQRKIVEIFGNKIITRDLNLNKVPTYIDQKFYALFILETIFNVPENLHFILNPIPTHKPT